jgi:hypothetical protein
MNKTAYIYKQHKDKGDYTVLLSHPLFSYGSHYITEDGIPVFYPTQAALDTKEFRTMLQGYRIIYRKPQRKTIRTMQWTILIEVIMEFKITKRLERMNNSTWKTAVNIFCECLWRKVFRGDPIPPFGMDLSYTGFEEMTIEQIYKFLRTKNINLN